MPSIPSARFDLFAKGSKSKIDAALRVVVFAVVLGTGTSARAQLRLRADALAQSRSPVGLLLLRGEDKVRPWIDAETVTWLGIDDSANGTGDVLTLSVRARDAKSGSEIRVGRMIVSMGAVRPVHVDGARGLVRVFGRTTIEPFAGVPVVRRFAYDTFDWTAGGRVGQTLGESTAFGASYAVRRRDGRTDGEEIGVDAAFTPTPWLTAAARSALDVDSRAPTDALASVSVQNRDLRGELFTTHRSPGRLLPRTSLFSVLGDFAATSSGATARWRAFPRLELVATGSVQVQGDDVGGQGLGRVTLALDDEWAGSLGIEGRRVDFAGGRWIGARGVAAVPLSRSFRFATEIELVRPDDGRRGTLWPWALAALAWTSSSHWEIASAIEAAAGPADQRSLHALLRAAYVFERGSR